MDRQPLTIGAVSLDCADQNELADFYARLLAGEVCWRSNSSAGVRAGAYTLVCQRVSDHRPPQWPGNSILHLDLNGGQDDLDRQREFAAQCGATIAPVQPDPRWTVLLDPAGHPFCITPFAPPEPSRGTG